jgi:hypothetical protein
MEYVGVVEIQNPEIQGPRTKNQDAKNQIRNTKENQGSKKEYKKHNSQGLLVYR